MSPDTVQCRMPELMKKICEAKEPAGDAGQGSRHHQHGDLEVLHVQASWPARSSLVRIATSDLAEGELRISATSASTSRNTTIT